MGNTSKSNDEKLQLWSKESEKCSEGPKERSLLPRKSTEALQRVCLLSTLWAGVHSGLMSTLWADIYSVDWCPLWVGIHSVGWCPLCGLVSIQGFQRERRDRHSRRRGACAKVMECDGVRAGVLPPPLLARMWGFANHYVLLPCPTCVDHMS